MRRDEDEQREACMVVARDEELRLILDEERAERRVSRVRARLDRAHRRLARAERRVDKQLRRVHEAEAELVACQQRRALGPPPVRDGERVHHPGRDAPHNEAPGKEASETEPDE